MPMQTMFSQCAPTAQVEMTQPAGNICTANETMRGPTLAEWWSYFYQRASSLRESLSSRQAVIATVSGWIQSSPEAWAFFYKLISALAVLQLLAHTWWSLPSRNETDQQTVMTWQTLRRLYLAQLAIVCLSAMISLHVQVRGLIGTQGIIPFPPHAAERIRRYPPNQILLRLEDIRNEPFKWALRCVNVLEARWWAYGCQVCEQTMQGVHTSGCWWLREDSGLTDAKITNLCWLGELAYGMVFLLSLCEGLWGNSISALLIESAFGLLRAVLLLVGFFSYRVLAMSSGVFTGLQWDSLILEESLLALPLALPCLPNCWLPSLMLPQQLCAFKCMFGSGVVKRRSRCPRWTASTAMDLHYETQPIPHLVSWYMHKLPHSWHACECWIAFLVQLPLTFLQWGPWPFRLVAFVGYAALMFGIGATGNYGFFNMQTAGLAMSFLDDAILPFALPPPCEPIPRLLAVAFLPAVALFGLWLSAACGFALLQLPRLHGVANYITGPVAEWVLSKSRTAHASLHPLGIGNSYGPFAEMTTFRWELIFEFSQDGASWTQLEFPYKPGCVNTKPKFMPLGHFQRLDWRLWFIPLSMGRGRWDLPDWVESFIGKLLIGSPSVAALTMHEDEIIRRPPAFVRVSVWEYHFSSCDPTVHQCPQVSICCAERDQAYSAQAPVDITNENGAWNHLGYGPTKQHPIEIGSWWYRRLVSQCGIYSLHNGKLATRPEAKERQHKAELTRRFREGQWPEVATQPRRTRQVN